MKYLSQLGFGLFLLWNIMIHLIKDTFVGRFLVVMILLGAAGAWYWTTVEPEISVEPNAPKQSVVIPGGASYNQVADSLIKHNLLRHKRLFLFFGKITGKEKTVHAGYFDIPTGLSTWELVHYMEKAPTKQVRVTVPEGLPAEKIAGIFARSLQIDSTRFMKLVADSAFVRELLGKEAQSLEGYLLPETYQLEWKTPPRQVLTFLVKRTLAIFEPDSVAGRLQEMNMTRHQLMTLASIVEGEAVVDSERTVIASLYHNRLRIGMRLQADPTIQYAIPGPPRRLLFKDLEYDSPYNTYKYKGLPPGPINNPGKASILASIYPEDTAFLYMVAYGDGSHKFSKTLKEHNYWHQRFNEVRRRERRKQRAAN